MANSLTLRIKALVSGAKDVLGLSKNVDKLGKESVETAKETDKLNSSLGRFSGVMRAAGAALAARAFAKTIADTESLSKGLEAVFGSAELASRELRYIKDVASQMGIKVSDAARSYLSLAAAAKGTALEGEQTRRIFESITNAMGRLGKSSVDTQGALVAIQQMMSKGKVSAEELRQQLGERLPGAFQLAAKSIGVTTAELDKMLATGQLTAIELLPKLSAELDKLYSGGGEINTLTANWNRLINAVSTFATESGKSANGTSLMSSALRSLATAINFVNVGLTSLIEYSKAAGTAFYEFIRLVSFSRPFDDFKKNVDDAFSNAQQRIADTADAVFGLDRNLNDVGASAKNAAKSVESLANAQRSLASAATEQAASAVVLVQQLQAIDELQQRGIITEQQAIENKQQLTAAYNEHLPVIAKTAAEADSLASSLSNYAKTAKTAAELDHVQSVAMRELGDNAVQLGAVMAVLSVRRQKLADETAKQTLKTYESIRADAQSAKSSFDLALAMVRLIEAKKALNKTFAQGQINQQQYNKQLSGLNKTISETAEKQNQQAGAQKDATNAINDGAASTKNAGDRQKVFNEVITDTSTVMDKMIAHLKFWQSEMDGISEAARRAFDGMVDAVNNAGGALVTSFDASAEAAQSNAAEIASLSAQIQHMRSAYDQATGDVNRWMIAVETAGLVVKRAYLQQDEAIRGLETRLENATTLTQEQADAAKQALASYTLLDQARLDSLRSQIDQIRQATEALNDSALATLTSLQNELDRMNGNLAAIEARNYELKRLQLLEQINAAQAAGDAAALAKLQQSLILLEKIHQIKMANLEADKKSNSTASSSASTRTSSQFGSKTSGRADSSTTTNNITIEVPVNLDGKTVARIVEPYITEFGRLSQ